MRTLALAITSALVVAVTAAAPAPAVAGPADQATLLQTRVDKAAAVFAGALASWKVGKSTVDDVAAWSVRWLTAEREQGKKAAKVKAALAAHAQRMKDLEAAATEAANKGTGTPIDREAAAYYAAEAELWVARGK